MTKTPDLGLNAGSWRIVDAPAFQDQFFTPDYLDWAVVNGGVSNSDIVSAPPVFSVNQIANQLRTQWGGGLEGTYRAFFGSNVTYSIADYYPTNAPYGEAQAYVMSPTMKNVARLGFELWDDAIAINLTESFDNPAANITMNWANLTFNGSGVLSTGGGTYARASLGGQSGGYYQITAQQIWLNMNWSSHDQDSDMFYGGYGVATFVHEIGHTLGLSHPGTYNAGNNPVTYANNAEFAQDNRQFTIMSYFGGYNPAANSWMQDGTSGSWYYPSTPMVYDIAAIQATYGADYTTRAGNSTYGFNITADVAARAANGLPVYSFDYNAHPIFTIWDGGGTDTLDCSGFSVNQYIDLTAGNYSSIAGMNGNIGIAYGCTIENAVGGSGNDTLIANGFGCWLGGGAGNDTLNGGAGNDRLVGGIGVDVLNGGNGADTFGFATGDSSAAGGQHDRINGFISGLDRIDLSGIDAIAASGAYDLFRFIGTSAFSGAAGELGYFYNGALGVTTLQGDTNGDRIADFAIDLVGNVTLAVGDFIGAVAASVVIEAFGQTQLTQNGNNFLLHTGASNLAIKYGGSDIMPNQFGAWTPIGAEQTAGGYQIAWKFGSADQYGFWTTDSSGNFIIASAVVTGFDSMITSLESSFSQDLNGDGAIGSASSVIEAFGLTELARSGNNFLLHTGASNLAIKFGGSNIVPNQFGAWVPIGAEQTAGGYQIVWKFGSADQYGFWTTDSSGNFINASAVVAGSDSMITSLESSFSQDLNGDGAIGSASSAIEAFGLTELARSGNNFFLHTGASNLAIKYGGSNIVPNQFGAWTPIGAEQTASGYQIAWKFGSADQYGFWTTDSSGNFINASAVVTGSDSMITSLESSFSQDLNGDGVIGPVVSVIEASGQTQLTQNGDNFFLHTGASTLAIKFGGGNIVPNQFGAWVPIGAEPTASGYQIVWKFGSADQYCTWTTDSNGNYITNSTAFPGSDSRLTSLESSFHQDLNGDGVTSSAPAMIASSAATHGAVPAMALSNQNPAFDVVHFLGGSNADGWHFKSVFQSGDAGISDPEGFALSKLLTELLNDALASRQDMTFTTADGAHDTSVNHDSGTATKAFVTDLHTGFLILH